MIHHRYTTALTQKHKSGFTLCNEHGWFKLSHERKQAAAAPVDTSSKHQEYDAPSNSYWNTELLLYISPVWSMSSQSEPEPYKETRIQIKCHNIKLQWPYRFLNRKKFKHSKSGGSSPLKRQELILNLCALNLKFLKSFVLIFHHYVSLLK